MKKYFCSLDDLFDTRLGIISMINPDVAQKIFEDPNKEYLYRMHDEYLWKSLYISQEQWDQLWANRDIEVLKNSLRTHVITIISESVLEYYGNREEALSSKSTSLSINTYPYNLSETEKDILKEVILEHIPVLENINFVVYNLNNLTINVLKEYDESYLYEFHKWMDIHGEALKNKLVTGISLRVPRLFYKVMTDADYKEFISTSEGKKIFDLDIFKMFEAALSTKMQITYIAASDFSVALMAPIYKNEDIKDLDHRPDQYGSGTVDKSLFDLQE